MKRLWTAFLTSLLTVSTSLAQSTSAPLPRPLTPAPQAPAAAAPATPSAPSGSSMPDAGPINPETGMPFGGPESVGESFESGTVRARRTIWGSIDYVYWIGKGDVPPPLVTTSPAGTPIATAGVLGAAGTTTLFGNNALNDEGRSGVKMEFGGWLDTQRTIGMQAGAFFVGDSSDGRNFASDGTTILARPFTSTVSGAASQLVAFNDAIGNVVSGSIAPREQTSVEGFDIAIRTLGCCGPCWRFDTLVGYRYLHLSDRLSIQQNLLIGPRGALVGAPPGAVVNTLDEFDTDNGFNGAEFGIAGEYRFLDRWTLDGTVKASYGYLNDRSTVTGFTSSTSAGVSTTSIGGLLALPGTNIGTFAHNQGQIVPELNLNLAYQISDRARLRVGYSFLYLNSVYRAGDRIDTTINPTFVPNNPAPGATSPMRPAPLNTQTEYYLHGFNVGLEFRF
ncbi:MAG TPA: BBP7 family outer membrane beta-barrel protein [Gemmataceae bacterium]|nr:BBP7 family outer membrane beta-barrel protein [Gemmataceae bacterium]